MVGNAVPCNLAYCLAKSINQQVEQHKKSDHHALHLTAIPQHSIADGELCRSC